MAVARAKLQKILWALVLSSSACSWSVAQTTLSPPPTGALTGKLTDLHSTPLAGITVAVRNRATGAVARTTTAKNGAYRFASLQAGAYTLEADSDQLGHGELDNIEINAGLESRVQAAMAFEPRPALAATAPTAPPLSPTIPKAPPAQAAPPHETALASPAPASPAPSIQHADLPIQIEPIQIAQPQAVQPQAQRHLDSAFTTPRLMPSIVPAASAAILATEPIASIQISPRPLPARTTTLETATPLFTAKLDPQPMQLLPLSSMRRAAPTSAMLSTVQQFDAAASALAMSVGTVHSTQANMDEIALEIVPATTSQSATTAITTDISATELQSLPAGGRRWQDFVLDTPTSSSAPGSSQASLRGAGQDPIDTTIDGVSTRMAFGAAAGSEPTAESATSNDQVGPAESGAHEGWSGGRGLAISELAISEVKTEAGNVEAEGSHAAGGRMSVETESGSNELHGQSFFFDRQNNWGAQNPFTQWVQNTGSAAAPSFTSLPYTPPDHELTWGVGMGSKLQRDKLFWFAALDSYNRNDPGLSTVKNAANFFTTYEPTSPEIVQLSAKLGESINQANNDYLGVPGAGYTAAGLEQLANLLGPAPRTATQLVGFARIDWQASERQRFTLEAIGAEWDSPGGGLTRVSEAFGSHSYGSSHASQEWLLARLEAFLTPNLLTVTQASAGREILTARPDAPSTLENGFLSASAWGQLPQITVDSRYGFVIGNPSRFGQGSYPDERILHGEEMLSWVHRSVLVKAGVQLDHNYDATSLLRNQTGTYHYSKVQNFISDALSFEKFGIDNLFNYENPHNCNPAGTGLGALPCFSYYSQTMGPTNWELSTNDWAGFVTAQWQPAKSVVFSAGMRWELEQLPPPIAALNNTALPLTQKLPSLGSEWGPRIGLALGGAKSKWPVLRLGYGMYFGRTENATIETALTQTGSLKGDLNFFIHPTDGLNPFTGTSGAPPFPYVLRGEPTTVVTPGAVEFSPAFHNSEIHQGLASIEETLPGRLMVTAAAMVSLGRKLPISIDTNLDPAVNPQTITYNVVDKTGTGPIKAPQIKVPYYALWPAGTCPAGSLQNISGQCGRLNPSYQQITEVMSRANSTYEAATIKLTRYAGRGLSLHAHYTYSHAMDWNPNESTTIAGSDVLDPSNLSEEYGTSNLDVRHSAAAMVVFESPWKLRDTIGKIANGWMLSGTAQFHSGLPYTMRTTGSIPDEFDSSGNVKIVGLGPSMNGSGGDNRVYGIGSNGRSYNIGRNTFRYPQAWKADLRLGKVLKLGEKRQLELLAETFNLFNHQNVTEIETTGYEIGNSSSSQPTLTYLTLGTTGTNATTAAFGTPLNINATNFYRERQIQFGARFRF
jgi:hypothetical protein